MDLDSELSPPEDIESFISNVMLLEEKGTRFYDKYNSRYLIEYLDRPKLEAAEKQLDSTSKRMSLVDFVKFFLGAIPHEDV